MTEYEYLYKKKRMCPVLLVGRSTIVELVSLKKKLSLLGAAPNRQNFEGSNFLKWASFAPTEYCVTYLPSDCPS